MFFLALSRRTFLALWILRKVVVVYIALIIRLFEEFNVWISSSDG